MVLKRGSWETRPKHWPSISNCICFVFVFADEHFWRTTTQRRCYTPAPVLAHPPCHKMSGIWLHPLVSLEHRASFENYNFRSQPRCKTAPLGLYLAANSTLVTRAPYFGADASSTTLPHLCLLQSTKRHPDHFWWVWRVSTNCCLGRDLFIVCKPSICLKLSVRCPTFYFYLHR